MKKVFIIHGHDSDLLNEVKSFVGSCGLEPVILREQDDRSMTIIEKFEFYGSGCVFAVALLTPDDKQAEELTEKARFRARQNVIYELGWFCGRLGREKTVLIHKGRVEMPSDLLGVLYLAVENSLFEVSGDLRRRFRGQSLLS